MKRLLLPLLTLFIVGCSGTAINKEGQNEVIKNIFEFQERLDRDGKEACESIVYEQLKLRQKKLFLEHGLYKTGYLSKSIVNKIDKIREFCGDYDFTMN